MTSFFSQTGIRDSSDDLIRSLFEEEKFPLEKYVDKSSVCASILMKSGNDCLAEYRVKNYVDKFYHDFNMNALSAAIYKYITRESCLTEGSPTSVLSQPRSPFTISWQA